MNHEPGPSEPAAPHTSGAEPSEAAAARPRIPAAALSARNALAREKGLPGVMIEGGEDPEAEATRARERAYVRLLVAMVAIIVVAGFVLGFVGLVVGGPAAS